MMIYKITYSNGDYHWIIDDTMLGAVSQVRPIAVEQKRKYEDVIRETYI